LDKIAERQLDYEMIKFDDLVKKQKLDNFSEVNLETASIYSAEDVYITNKLFESQENDENNTNILEKMDFPFIEVLKNMELS
jgi:DNA polymerase I-like protein with 3'-5' exonuclease and polymerase domains